jgi:hypothetical protein
MILRIEKGQTSRVFVEMEKMEKKSFDICKEMILGKNSRVWIRWNEKK